MTRQLVSRDDVDDGDQDLVDALRDWFEEGDHRVRGLDPIEDYTSWKNPVSWSGDASRSQRAVHLDTPIRETTHLMAELAHRETNPMNDDLTKPLER